MAIITFLGRVLPEFVQLTLTTTPSLQWRIEELDLTVKFYVNIVNSNISITCDTPTFRHEDTVHFYTRACDLARGAVDLCAFCNGYGLSVYVGHYTVDEGEPYEILIENTDLSKNCKSYNLDRNFDKVLPIIYSDAAIFMALNDLTLANTVPHHSIVNCARVVDGLRHLIGGVTTPAKQGWPLLRTALNVDESYLKYIMDPSAKPRHGNRTAIPGSIAKEVVNRTWVLFDRFLSWKLGGDHPLAEPTFPTLKG